MEKSYNGDIARLRVESESHTKRLDDLEDIVREDHDTLTKLCVEVSELKKSFIDHLEYHRDRLNQQITMKHGLIFVAIQSLFLLILKFL